MEASDPLRIFRENALLYELIVVCVGVHGAEEALERFGGINEIGKHIASNTTHRVRTRALKRKARSALQHSASYSIT
jgi:hypothetical protein